MYLFFYRWNFAVYRQSILASNRYGKLHPSKHELGLVKNFFMHVTAFIVCFFKLFTRYKHKMQFKTNISPASLLSVFTSDWDQIPYALVAY